MAKSANPYQERIARQVSELISPVVADLGFELVEILFRREQHGNVLRVVIFAETGIAVDDCALVSREVSRILDVEEIIDQAYQLEVSSPGLDRPLETARDFSRYPGKQVRIILAETLDEVTGKILDVDDGRVRLALDDGQREIELAQIVKAKLVVDF
ncbi:MAG: ribosome maturation factor RimP [Desulfobulbaceae bacterium]|nr:ribosome maturation factor RimP [Desulfobulbaceae bacterium]